VANKYCDHGLYTYAATPTWGVAQDGDGTASGAATSATASIVFTGIPSSGAIAVLGVTLSPTWATNADTCANNLATAINASTTTAAGPAGITVKSQVRNHLYARGPSSGAAGGTCEIMMRQGTADVNGQICITHTLNNVSSGATINFSGGAGGAWGWIWNVAATIWPSAVAIGQYGIGGATLPFCGSQVAGDVVTLRSNKTITLTSNGISVTTAALGTAQNPVTWVVDNSTVWADGSNPVLKFTAAYTNNSSWQWSTALACWLHVRAKQYTGGQRSLVFEQTGTGATTPNFHMRPGAGKFENLDFVATGTCANTVYCAGSQGNFAPVLIGCRQVWAKENSYTGTRYVTNSGNNTTAMTLISHTFEQTAPTGVQTVMALLSNSGTQRATFLGCAFVGFVVGSRLFDTPATINGETGAQFRDCNWGNVTVRGPFIGAATSMGPIQNQYLRGIASSSSNGSRDFSTDLPVGFAEWSSSRNFPKLNATLPDGVTKWSLRLVPTQLAANISATDPFQSPKMEVVNSFGTDAVRTITCEMALEQSLTWTTANISLAVTYMDSTGVMRYEDTYDSAGSALATSTSTWSAESGGQVTFDDGGTVYCNKRKLAITTAHSVEAGSVMTVWINVHTSVNDTAKSIFVCPEPLVT
jgi:hypothetical protein